MGDRPSELGSSAVWINKDNFNVPVLHFGSPPPVAKKAKKSKKSKAEEPQFDSIHRPEHYNVHPSGIEPIDIAKHETFFRGNILKYVMRAPYKGNELQDLKKAAEFLRREIERVEQES